MKWQYGVTTTRERLTSLLPRTLLSLEAAGFPEPRLFVDGAREEDCCGLGLPVTCHYPKVLVFGNWILGLAELYLRDAEAERYAMFQDDFVTYRNLREYLEQTPYPTKGYCNLYTFPQNQALCGKVAGWYPSNQRGKGAVALVFDRDAVVTLLSHQLIVERPIIRSPKDAVRWWKSIDGGFVNAFSKAGWTEYCHNPSLVQHTGTNSSIGNRQHPRAVSFQGEDFDAMELLG